ncbi:SHOCT domain-containing protein [Streptomyces sp. NPDC004749]
MAGYVELAYDYPVLGVFLSVLWFFLWVLWLVVLFRVIIDIFRDRKLSGWAKAGWLLFVLVVPFLGVLVYVIARGRGMGEREVKHVQEQQQAFESYVRDTARGSKSSADELTALSDLRSKGVLSDAEFERAKEKVLH